MRPTKQSFLDRLAEANRSGVFPGYKKPNCVYLTPDGRQCAIGCQIPRVPENAKYLEFVGTADDLVGVHPEVMDFFPEGTAVTDLIRIQRVHDNLALSLDGWWNPSLFMERLLRLEYFAGMTPGETPLVTSNQEQQ